MTKGTVVDGGTGKPLSYCNVGIKGSSRGTITNEEGDFKILTDSVDSLLISYIGYQKRTVPVRYFSNNRIIQLQKKELNLQEITIHGNKDLGYITLNNCRKKVRDYGKTHTSKVYYGLEASSKGTPIEILECYYNGKTRGTDIEHLGFKNGRVGWKKLKGRFFVSLDISKAISRISLIHKDDLFPRNPFQFSKWRMKKLFRITEIVSSNHLYRIAFEPKEDGKDLFSGAVWIHKENFDIEKFILHGEDLKVHPFTPLAQKDSLKNVDLRIEIEFKDLGGEQVVQLVHFDYSFDYFSNRNGRYGSNSQRNRTIKNKGIMYFYDHDSPFILPYFEHYQEASDYRKMTFIPYDPVFWKENNKLILSEKKKRKLGDIAREGRMIHFKESYLQGQQLRVRRNWDFFQVNYTFWSGEERLYLKKNIPKYKEPTAEELHKNITRSMYHLECKLFLDVTRIGSDSLHYRTFAVFDPFRTYYHLPEYKYSNCFINIYFDIHEFKRRKMEEEIGKGELSLERLERLLERTQNDLDATLDSYVDQTRSGKDREALFKWNEYVRKRLGVDNFKRFGLKEP